MGAARSSDTPPQVTFLNNRLHISTEARILIRTLKPRAPKPVPVDGDQIFAEKRSGDDNPMAMQREGSGEDVGSEEGEPVPGLNL